jgi:protein phosphatase
LFVVADGMGGAAAGKLASRIVVEVLPPLLRDHLAKTDRSDRDEAATAQAVSAALVELSDRLRDESQKHRDIRGMGSTVVMALVCQGRALLAHMGDSRAYLLRGKTLQQLTVDHTIAQTLVDSGAITAEVAKTHPYRSSLTRFVGMRESAKPTVQWTDLQPDDRLLLCSDGLSGMLSPDQLAEILSGAGEPAEVCAALIAAANAAGGNDNVTAVVVAVDGETV